MNCANVLPKLAGSCGWQRWCWRARGSPILMAGTTTFGNKGFGVVVAPFAAVIALIAARWLAGMKREGWAFILTGLAIVLTVASLFIALFPNVMISSTTSVNNLTIYNASSSAYTLKVMSIVAAIMVPIVLLYQAWTYRVFRKRIAADAEKLVILTLAPFEVLEKLADSASFFIWIF